MSEASASKQLESSIRNQDNVLSKSYYKRRSSFSTGSNEDRGEQFIICRMGKTNGFHILGRPSGIKTDVIVLNYFED